MPVASYVPVTISGNIVFVSGQIPIADGAIKYVGKLGVDVPLEAGQAAAQLCAINILAQLKAAIGDLDRVVKCLRLGVFVNAAARLLPASRSRQWCLRPDRRAVRRCREACARRRRRRLAAARRGGGSGRDIRDQVTARKLITSAAEIGRTRWNALANPHGVGDPHPFTTYEFFAALEESGSACAKTGWQPAHLLADDGLMPLYLKSHSYGEYVFDHAWAEALEQAGGDYYPKLQCAVPFTPVTGRRLLGNARDTLLKTAAAATKQINASSLHITFLTREEWLAAGTRAICCAPVSSFTGTIPAIRLSTSSWANYRPPSAKPCARNALRSRKPA